MAQLTLYNQANNWITTLNTTMNDSTTTMVLTASGGTGAPEVPFILSIDNERMICTARTNDTLTVTRGADGTSAAAHTAGAYVQVKIVASNLNDLARDIRALKRIVADMLGAGSGVVRTDALDELKVVAQGSPNMTVSITAGAANVSGQCSAIIENTTTTAMVAPSTNPRIDVVEITQENDYNIVTGSEAASPSAPSVSANCLKLAEIYHRVGSTSIKNTDDSTNSYITDSRVYL